MRGARMYSGTGDILKRLGIVLGADGHGTGPLRRFMSYLLGLNRLTDLQSNAVEKDGLGREHLKMNFHVCSLLYSIINGR